MRVAILLLAHLLVRIAMLPRLGGVRTLLAENLLLKQQLLVLQQPRRRAVVGKNAIVPPRAEGERILID